jgi:pimeloyl-ACP methyl ester carboxylesterase
MRTFEIGQYVKAAGRQLWMHRSGDGGPAVVFAPGAGMVGLDYLKIHERVAELTTSVLYDRAGTGWSDGTALPRTPGEVTDELRDLLRAAGVPAPYILVGHSLGGVYTRRYAQRFPDEVAGLVLLEPMHEDWDAYVPEHLRLEVTRPADAELPTPNPQIIAHVRQVFEGLLAAWPDFLRQPLVDQHTSPDGLLAGLREGSNIAAALAELRSGGQLPDVPVTVFGASGFDPGQRMFQSEADLRVQIDATQQLFKAIAAAAPQGEYRLLDNASHSTIPMERPDAVANAVADMVKRQAGA